MSNGQSNQILKVEELYKEVGTNYRYFLSWRHRLLAGYFVILAALSIAFSWLYKKAHSLLWVTFSFGIIITVVFWALEYRNRDLYHACQNTGEQLEKNNAALDGIYLNLNKLQGKSVTHSLAINILYIATIITMIVALVCFFSGSF
jgi:hypothetical protein